MSFQEKDPNGPPPPYYPNQPQTGAPVYTYPSEGPNLPMYPGQHGQATVYGNQQGQNPMYGNQQGSIVYQQPGPGMTTVIVTPALQNPPPDQMIYAIFVTLCCCWPIGIFAILKSLACREAINRGDRHTATELSNTARRLSHAALGCGIALAVLSILFVIIYLVAVIPNITRNFGDLD